MRPALPTQRPSEQVRRPRTWQRHESRAIREPSSAQRVQPATIMEDGPNARTEKETRDRHRRSDERPDHGRSCRGRKRKGSGLDAMVLPELKQLAWIPRSQGHRRHAQGPADRRHPGRAVGPVRRRQRLPQRPMPGRSSPDVRSPGQQPGRRQRGSGRGPYHRAPAESAQPTLDASVDTPSTDGPAAPRRPRSGRAIDTEVQARVQQRDQGPGRAPGPARRLGRAATARASGERPATGDQRDGTTATRRLRAAGTRDSEPGRIRARDRDRTANGSEPRPASPEPRPARAATTSSDRTRTGDGASSAGRTTSRQQNTRLRRRRRRPSGSAAAQPGPAESPPGGGRTGGGDRALRGRAGGLRGRRPGAGSGHPRRARQLRLRPDQRLPARLRRRVRLAVDGEEVRPAQGRRRSPARSGAPRDGERKEKFNPLVRI